MPVFLPSPPPPPPVQDPTTLAPTVLSTTSSDSTSTTTSEAEVSSLSSTASDSTSTTTSEAKVSSLSTTASDSSSTTTSEAKDSTSASVETTSRSSSTTASKISDAPASTEEASSTSNSLSNSTIVEDDVPVTLNPAEESTTKSNPSLVNSTDAGTSPQHTSRESTLLTPPTQFFNNTNTIGTTTHLELSSQAPSTTSSTIATGIAGAAALAPALVGVLIAIPLFLIILGIPVGYRYIRNKVRPVNDVEERGWEIENPVYGDKNVDAAVRVDENDSPSQSSDDAEEYFFDANDQPAFFWSEVDYAIGPQQPISARNWATYGDALNAADKLDEDLGASNNRRQTEFFWSENDYAIGPQPPISAHNWAAYTDATGQTYSVPIAEPEHEYQYVDTGTIARPPGVPIRFWERNAKRGTGPDNNEAIVQATSRA